MAASGAQLTLDGGDRLHARLVEAGRPLAVADAATCLFALRSAPAALVRQLVDEVVRADARFAWRSGTEIALAEWEDAGSLLDAPLEQADYVVFDLETTGTRPARPGSSRWGRCGSRRSRRWRGSSGWSIRACPSRPPITALTGIPPRAPARAAAHRPVLEAFLRFCAGAVLVAHNARFDVGFVDAELRRLRGGRLAAPVIDTVALGRRLLGDRLPRMDLGTLAERFDTEVRPCHRALPDAEATAEVLVQLLGMAQERGAAHGRRGDRRCARRPGAGRPAAAAWPRGVPPRARRLPVPGRHRARALRRQGDRPARPGALVLLRPGAAGAGRAGGRGGGAGRDAAARLRVRGRAARARADRAAAPAANTRGANPDRACYLVLTLDEPVPRLRVSARPGTPRRVTAGPLRSRQQAEAVAAAVRDAFGLRVCRPRLPVDDGSCLAGVIGTCRAPCRGGDGRRPARGRRGRRPRVARGRCAAGPHELRARRGWSA